MENLRAYLRDVGGLPIEQQRCMARDAGVTVVYEHGEAGPRRDVRRGYVQSLRAGDTAWLPRLDVLILPKAERQGRRSTTDVATVIADILALGAVIEEGTTGVTSKDGEAWRERFEWLMRKAGTGRMTRAKAKRIGAKGGAVLRARAVATRWKSPAMRAERERWAAVWRDPIYGSAEAAAEAVDVDDLRGRVTMCYRVFGPRRPGDPRAGGRPRKKKR